MNGEEQWKSDDSRSVERRLNNWGTMNIKTQRSIYRERQYRVCEDIHIAVILLEYGRPTLQISN